MALFVCDKCYTIENTACGWFSCSRNNPRLLGPEYPIGMVLCSACTPTHFHSGELIKGLFENMGRWHNSFKRELATKEWAIEKQSEIYIKKNQGFLDVLNGIPPKVVVDVPFISDTD